MPEPELLKPIVTTTITYKHPYAGHIRMAQTLRAVGLEYEMPVDKPEEVRILVPRNIPAEEVQAKATEVIITTLRAMGVTVGIDASH